MNTTTKEKTQEQWIDEWLLENVTGMDDNDVEAQWDECLDMDGDTVIGSLHYTTSWVLKQIDETAYRCGLNDFTDGENYYEANGLYYTSEQRDEAEEAYSEMMDELENKDEDEDKTA